MSSGPLVHRREGATRWHKSSALVLAFVGLSTGVGCEGCDEQPPDEGEPSLVLTSRGGQLEADGVTFIEMTARAFDAAGDFDNRPITVTANSGTLLEGTEAVGTQLTGTPSNGALNFGFRCDELEAGNVSFTATNGAPPDGATASYSIECIEPVGNIGVTVSDDATEPCANLQADGRSSCVKRLKVELISPNVVVAQRGLPLTAAVSTAFKANPGDPPDTPADSLDLVSAVDGTSPQAQVALTTDENGETGFRVYSTDLNQQMVINVAVTGTAGNGQALNEVVTVSIREFINASAVSVVPQFTAMGSGLTQDVTVNATNQFGEQAAGAIATLRVSTSSGAVLRQGAVVSDSETGELEVTLDANGSAVVQFEAPEVDEQQTVTVTVEYQPDVELPVVADTTPIKIYPENSVILVVEAQPTEIWSDANDIATVTATVKQFSAGAENPMDGATVRFSVGNSYRERVGIGTRNEGEDPPLDDPELTLSRDVVTDAGGIASAQVSSRNDRARGTVEIGVEVLENDVAVQAETVVIQLFRQPILQSIVFVSAVPSQIGVRGSAYPSSSVLSFQVLDDLNKPLPNVIMAFDVNATADPGAGVVAQGLTDNAGLVQTVLSAGTESGPISVVATATYNGKSLTAESIPIAVTGGLPSFANSYLQCDDVLSAMIPPAVVTCVATLADRFTNRVPQNLPVQMRAEGGNIEPALLTGAEGGVEATFVQGAPGGVVSSLLSYFGESWSFGAVVPTSPGDTVASTDGTSRWQASHNLACYDADRSSKCSTFDLCFEAEADQNLAQNQVYCPLPYDPLDDVGCWNKLEAGAVTGDASHLSAGLLASLGITQVQAQALLDSSLTPQTYYLNGGAIGDQVRAIVKAHIDNMHRCGYVTACLTGQSQGIPWIEGDECPLDVGCMDFNVSTTCPHDGLRTITAIVRGEESFTDLNGNGTLDYVDVNGDGRHNPNEAITELGLTVPLNFHDIVLDMPEPFLDKNDNCFVDDYTGLARLPTYSAIRQTDVYSDEDGSGSFGYTLVDEDGNAYPEPFETNQQWDRDKQIFVTDHIMLIEGYADVQLGEKCDGLEIGSSVACQWDGNLPYLCEDAGDGEGFLRGCYPRQNEVVPEGSALNLGFRWVDRNGNCFSPGFDNGSWAYEPYFFDTESDYRYLFEAVTMNQQWCGFQEGRTSGREWCESLPVLGAGRVQTVAFAPTCFYWEAGLIVQSGITFVNSSGINDVVVNEEVGAIYSKTITFRVQCAGP